MKKIFLLALLIFCALALPSRFKLLTYGFKVQKLGLDLASSVEWEVSSQLSKMELLAIFSKPFSFLGKGAQSYVFESSDGQYVLKLFRFDHRKRSFLDRDRWVDWKKKTACSLFSSCVLAWNLAREETALVHLHLNPTIDEYPPFFVISPLGRKVVVNLDRSRFALQKKALSLEEGFKIGLKDGTLDEKITAISDLLYARTQKKLINRDPSLWRNFGFIGNKAVEIDFGNYELREDRDADTLWTEEKERFFAPLRIRMGKIPPDRRSTGGGK